MAKVSFDSIPERDPNNGNGSGNAQVRFFNLKSGESAIVRIMVDTIEDLDIRTVHNVEMPGYQYGRRMNCLRNPQEPIELCPLCKANKKLEQKLYLKMIQYTVDPATGAVNKEAKVWERSVWDKYFGAQVIKSNIETYGPLSDMICKIERRGEKLNTEYSLMPNLNPAVYRPDIYVKDESMFNGWDPLGVAILDKTAAEYQIFLTTGQFPQQNQTPNAIPTAAPQYNAPMNAHTTAIPNAEAAGTFNASAITPRTPYTPNNQTEAGYAPSTPTFNPVTAPPAAAPAPTGAPMFNAPQAPAAMPWETQKLPFENGASVPQVERPRRY